ncbi:aspartate kinase, monofunctional class [Paenibacillus vortex V453]|jgi:aspartate kinase|uniref:Aspartokinase n=1 Tax=Paenibacillus vortex V453 TaxID=715225 RepID=A0A2R9SRQ8_9BACL|nr:MULTISPECIES: aspartate kinase [Paenibacillus]ANA83119.1 aspartate kinase [Paenibacillus glucanolyticus]AVV57791.1 aspartate kinase [Paenibacillus glucanolyticus]AWP26953.1 aspartate kinase [Paenibacillus sp. Cedars]EFU40070.1 aspartate kinase, monofunctional class [Paenibacillus vortex V453]ETT34571.1 aspartate kinase, monofunctional class [Paenibacillus sp. FSL R5-808]
MRILVQKFGGTSLSTPQARTHVIGHIQRELANQYQLVVVVSAMGRRGEPYATDTLLDWIGHNGNALPSRERDLLLCCGEIISATTLCSLLQHEGITATVLTGAQAGFLTDDHFGNARIKDVKPERVLKELEYHQVVIVTGFQGQTDSGDFTTLGRGGSDTSATALGAALRAEMVDIYTDVNGILTADPRIVEDAKPLSYVSYTEICNMAHQGAKVIHPRAVEIAMQSQIPVRVRSTFSDNEGTLVTQPEGFRDIQSGIVDRFVTGVAYVSNITQISVECDRTEGLQLKVFKSMAEHSISVDFINVTPTGVLYTVFDSDSEKAIEVLQGLDLKPKSLSGCAKVSVIGGGINGVPGIMAKIVESLSEHDISILQSADSNTTIWVLVKKEDMAQALRALHHKFELHV